LNEFFVPNTNELKLQRVGRLVARYDSFNSREMIFRIVVEGAISILSPKIFSSDCVFEIIEMKKFKKSDNEIRHIIWCRGIPSKEMSLSLNSLGKGNVWTQSEITVKSDASQGLIAIFIGLKSLAYHIVNWSPKSVIRDLDYLFELVLRQLGRLQQFWYRPRNLKGKYSKAWIFIDRPLFGDDNAEHLYRYVKNEHPEINSFYLLKRESKDWTRLEHEGFDLIPIGSPHWKAAFLQADVVLSSQVSRSSVNPFPMHFHRHLSRKFVFLRHGIGISNRHTWLNKWNIDLMVVGTPWEYEEIVNGDSFKFTNVEVKATGLARYDKLFLSAEPHSVSLDTILIMPTWRKEFVKFTGTGANNGARSINQDSFENSKFFLEWGNFLTNPKLKQIGMDNGVKFRLLLHPNLASLLNFFELPDFIELHDSTGDSFQDTLLKAKALITDYTSVAFDMAYINRPTLYMQFDKYEFFQADSSSSRVKNLDYVAKGFGPVAANSEQLINNLSEFLIDGLDPKYYERMTNFFSYKDADSRKRIIDEVLKKVGS
jgi:CDP-glycerol glycerophosphotransferase (TagB/SpsB family)